MSSVKLYNIISVVVYGTSEILYWERELQRESATNDRERNRKIDIKIIR